MASGTPLDQSLRQHNKQRRLSTNAYCTSCGERDMRTLQRTTLCAECRLRVQGKSHVEEHHPSGRHNAADTVAFAANDHAILSDCQHDWPEATFRNPNRDPLRGLAALLRALRDTCALVIDRLDSVIPWVEALSDALTKRFDAAWWVSLEI